MIPSFRIDAMVASGHNVSPFAERKPDDSVMTPAEAAKLPAPDRLKYLAAYRRYAEVPGNRSLYTVAEVDEAINQEKAQ